LAQILKDKLATEAIALVQRHRTLKEDLAGQKLWLDQQEQSQEELSVRRITHPGEVPDEARIEAMDREIERRRRVYQEGTGRLGVMVFEAQSKARELASAQATLTGENAAELLIRSNTQPNPMAGSPARPSRPSRVAKAPPPQAERVPSRHPQPERVSSRHNKGQSSLRGDDAGMVPQPSRQPMLNEVVVSLQGVCGAPMYQRVVTVCADLFGKAQAPGTSDGQKALILDQMCKAVIETVGQHDWANALEITRRKIAMEEAAKALPQPTVSRYEPGPVKIPCPWGCGKMVSVTSKGTPRRHNRADYSGMQCYDPNGPLPPVQASGGFGFSRPAVASPPPPGALMNWANRPPAAAPPAVVEPSGPIVVLEKRIPVPAGGEMLVDPRMISHCDADRIVFEKEYKYATNAVLCQMLGWYGQDMKDKLWPLEFEMNGLIRLPDIEACYGKGTEYKPAVRAALIQHISTSETQGLAWPKMVQDAFPPSVGDDEPKRWGFIGSPMLGAVIKSTYIQCVERLVYEMNDRPLKSMRTALKGFAPNWEDYQLEHERWEKEMEENNAQATWVQCEKKHCRKWRRLPPGVDPAEVPDVFVCNKNKWDPHHSKCDAPQEDQTGFETLNFNCTLDADELEAEDIIDAFCSKESEWLESKIADVVPGVSIRVSFLLRGETYEELIQWADVGDRVAEHRTRSCPDGEVEVYCVEACNHGREEGSGNFMISCDCCDDWFHGDCIGIPKDSEKAIAAFKCFACGLDAAFQEDVIIPKDISEPKPAAYGPDGSPYGHFYTSASTRKAALEAGVALKESKRPMKGKKMAAVKLSFGNEHMNIAGPMPHRWTAFVRAVDGVRDGENQHGIKKVKFMLHQDFKPNTVTLTKPPFEITRDGVGVFDIRAEITMKDGKVRKLSRDLNFTEPSSFKTFIASMTEIVPIAADPNAGMYSLGNAHKAMPEGSMMPHQWTAFVRGMDGKPLIGKDHEIKQVMFYIHPDYIPSEILVKKPPFEITMEGYAEFKVEADIVLKTGKILRQGRMLDFKRPLSWTNFASQKKPKAKKKILSGPAGPLLPGGKLPDGSKVSFKSPFECFLPDFKKSDAAKEATHGDGMEKGERMKLARQLARAKWESLTAEERAPYETKSQEARAAAIVSAASKGGESGAAAAKAVAPPKPKKPKAPAKPVKPAPRLTIGNRHKPVKGPKPNQWTVLIRNKDGKKDDRQDFGIDRVVFYLHQDFAPDNVVTVTSPPWEVTRESGDGEEFQVCADVTMKEKAGGGTFRQFYDLRFKQKLTIQPFKQPKGAVFDDEPAAKIKPGGGGGVSKKAANGGNKKGSPSPKTPAGDAKKRKREDDASSPGGSKPAKASAKKGKAPKADAAAGGQAPKKPAVKRGRPPKAKAEKPPTPAPEPKVGRSGRASVPAAVFEPGGNPNVLSDFAKKKLSSSEPKPEVPAPATAAATAEPGASSTVAP